MARNKIEFAGEVLIDLTADTVTPETLMQGVTAHDRSGVGIVGTAINPSGTINITENGTHNVKEYETANVNVPIPSDYIKPSGSLIITENGTVDVKYYETANVNVPAASLIKVGEMTVSFTANTIDCTSYANYDKWTKDDFYLVPKAFAVFSTTGTGTTGTITLGTYYFSQSYKNGVFSAQGGSVSGNVGLQFPCEVYVYDKTGANFPIPDGYIKPSGTIEITENGTYDVTDKAEVVVNVASSGGSGNKLGLLVSGDTVAITADDIAGITKIGENAFSYNNGLTSIDIPSGVTEIGSSAFNMCVQLTHATMQYGVISIGSAAFAACKTLLSIEIPESVESIGQSAFYNCFALASANLPNKITQIPNSLFRSCAALTSINIPDGVTSIGNYAFEFCAISKIKLPSAIVNIGNDAFYGCDKLELIDCRSVTAVPTISSTSVFYKVPSTCKVVIPDTLYDAWIAATNWSALSVTWVKESEYVE